MIATIEKAKVEAMKARLFARLREHFQRRDRLRLVIGYRRKYLESLVRQGEEEAGKIAQKFRQASVKQEQEYAETAAALAEKKELTAGEAAEVSQLWRELVKLFHPDRFAHEPEKQETYHKLTAAINHAKDHGDLATLRRIAEGHPLFPLVAGAASHGASRNCAGCGRASNWKSSACWRRGSALKESPDYELHRLTTQTPAYFDETVRRHVECLEKDLTVLESEAQELAKEIEELIGEPMPGIR